MREVVNRLPAVRADAVVTITAPLDHRRPNNDRDRITVRNLLAEARAQVREGCHTARSSSRRGSLCSRTRRGDKEQWRNFYREVDGGLSAVAGDDPLPLVLAGVDASTRMFEEVSDNASSVIGRVSGAQEHATAHSLGSEAWPLVVAHLRARSQELIAELGEAIHTGDAVTGIDESWQLARAGRGRTLVVEEGYRADPAREVDNRLVWSNPDPSRDVMDDPVDELIEHVVRTGGTVEFVGAGSLSHLGRIGLILR